METNTVTPNMVKRTAADWSGMAKELIKVEEISGTLYGFGSELGCLRIFHQYNRGGHATHVRCEFSKNLGTWFIALDVRL
jgi:hypothetical protein